MNEKRPPSSGQPEAVLRRFALLHRVNAYVFWIAMLLIFGGLASGCILGEPAGVAMLIGFALGFVLILETYLVYPFLICPHCGNRFFLPNGWLGLIAKVGLLQRSCVHCGQELPRGRSARQVQ